jgi:hypothetical protein
VLHLVEFSDPFDGGSDWDYSVEANNYFRIKSDISRYLGNESRSDERNKQHMDAVWNLGQVGLFVSCDVKTGGCEIGLRFGFKPNPLA